MLRKPWMRILVAGTLTAVLFCSFAFGAYFALYPIKYKGELLTAAKRFDLEPALVAAVVRTESRFRRDAVSSKGAVGLMQLMPGTAEDTAKKLDRTAYDLLSPEDNFLLGCAYLSEMLLRFDGDELLGLAAFNAGPTRVEEWRESGSGLQFLETADYVRRVLNAKRWYAFRF